jgi:hypothetical protein
LEAFSFLFIKQKGKLNLSFVLATHQLVLITTLPGRNASYIAAADPPLQRSDPEKQRRKILLEKHKNSINKKKDN